MPWDDLSSEINETFSGYEGFLDRAAHAADGDFSVFRDPTTEAAKAEAAARRSRLLHLRTATGACTRCGGNREIPGFKRCSSCRFLSLLFARGVCGRRKELGLCRSCGADSGGLRRCLKCKASHAARSRKHYAAQPKEDIAAFARQRRAARKAAGLCTSCGAEPAVESGDGARCLAARRKRRKALASSSAGLVG